MTDLEKANEIIDKVARYFGVGKEDITKKSRKHPLTFYRFLAYRAIKKETHLTLKKIGELFNVDHSSVKNGLTSSTPLDDYLYEIFGYKKEQAPLEYDWVVDKIEIEDNEIDPADFFVFTRFPVIKHDRHG
jgi:hypothetical protein